MSRRLVASAGSFAMLVAVIAVVVLAAAPLAGQSPGRSQAVKKTPWGDPDLQGVYTFSTLTPAAASRCARRKSGADRSGTGRTGRVEMLKTAWPRIVRSQPGNPGTYNNFWTSNEKGRRTGRSSLIVDPPDGRRPPMTAAGDEDARSAGRGSRRETRRDAAVRARHLSSRGRTCPRIRNACRGRCRGRIRPTTTGFRSCRCPATW